MRPASIVVLLALGALPSLSTNTWACSCVETPDFATAFAQSRAVFLGQVIDVSSASPEYFEAVWATFRVETHWKGQPPDTVRVLTGAHSGICGVDFQPGERYLVYALGGGSLYGPLPKGELWTHSCWRTHSYWAGDPDLVLLGPTPVVTASWGSVKILYR